MKARSVLTVVLFSGAALIFPLTAAAEEAPARFVAPHFDEELVFYGVRPPGGELLARELNLLSQLMRCRRTNKTHPIHPRLARRLVQLSQISRRPVVVVSGYRAVAVHGHRRSYHLRGMAADIRVPGLTPAEVRDFAVRRRLGGIGFYPNSGFVHIDVRPRRFWWADYSGPGQREELIPDPEGNAPSVRPVDTATIASNDQP